MNSAKKSNRILVPMDFSQAGDQALQIAERMANAETQLHLLHVNQPTMVYTDAGGVVPPMVASSTIVPSIQQVEARLADVSVPPEFGGERTTRVVVDGIPSTSIVDYANQNEIDLVVMTTHGHSGLTRLLMGSVAEYVVRKADCTVLTLKPTISAEMAIRRVLLPIDFSPLSEQAIPVVERMATDETEIHVLHVDQPKTLPPTAAGSPAVPTKQQLLEKMAVLPWSNRINSSRIKRAVVEGSPVESIVEYADQNEIDLIMITTHGHTGISRLLMGSVAEQIVRKAECPVLTLKSGNPENQQLAEG